MPEWTVSGRFLARRNDWQRFTKSCDVANAEQAREWILSEIGGCHHVRRSLIRVESIEEAHA